MSHRQPAHRGLTPHPPHGIRAATDARSSHRLTALQALLAVAAALLLAAQADAAEPGPAVAVAAGPATPGVLLSDGSLVLARYSTTAAAPEATRGQPLAVVATVHFPRATVTTIGEALRHLLVRTGYSLVQPDLLDPLARNLLTLNLPDSQRQLGPYRVDAMLQVILGEGWSLSVDPLQRSVSFAPAAVQSATPVMSSAQTTDAPVALVQAQVKP